MIVNYLETNGIMRLQTLYDHEESVNIGKSICTIHKPCDVADDKCTCTFYNRNSGKMFDIQLSNSYMYEFYKYKQSGGLRISESDKYLVISSIFCGNGKTVCYSMENYKKLWESDCLPDSHFYIYKDKLFYYNFPTKNKGIIGVADIKNPNLQNEILSFPAKASPNTCRLNDDYLLLYCSGKLLLLNVHDEKLYLSNVSIQEPSEFFRFDKIVERTADSFKFCFSEFKQEEKNAPYKWVQEYKDIPINNLFKDLKINPLGNKIPTI